MKLLATITALFLLSCSTSKISRQHLEGVNLMNGEIAANYVQARIITLRPCPVGYRYKIVSNSGDTLIYEDRTRLRKDSCYYFPKTKIKY